MSSFPSCVAVVCDYALDYVGGAQTALVEQVRALAGAGCDVVVVSPSSPDAVRRVGIRDDVADRASAAASRSADLPLSAAGSPSAVSQPAAASPSAVAPPPSAVASGEAPVAPGVVSAVQVPGRFVLPGVGLPVVRNSAGLRDRLRGIFAEHRVEAVQLHSEFGVAAAAIDVARERGLPVVQTVHTFFWQTTARPQRVIAGLVRRFHHWITGITPTRAHLADRPADAALRNMTLAVARRVDRVVSPSAHQAQRLREAGLDHVVVVPNTVTVAGRAEGGVLRQVTEPVRILWIGRCEPEKRILPFVRAVAAAQRDLGPGRLRAVVVGDGSQLVQARRTAQGADIEFLGRQDRDRIPQLLAGAHLAALTSYGFDNQPMTIVEAVTAGRGVVYCDPALAEGLSGPGVPVPHDEDGMAAALADVVDHPERIVAASRATERARDEFAPRTHARRMLECYAAAAAAVRKR